MAFALEEEQIEEGWSTTGHPYLHQRICRKFSRQEETIVVTGLVEAYLSVEASGDGFCYFFHRHQDGDTEELELDEVEAGIALFLSMETSGYSLHTTDTTLNMVPIDPQTLAGTPFVTGQELENVGTQSSTAGVSPATAGETKTNASGVVLETTHASYESTHDVYERRKRKARIQPLLFAESTYQLLKQQHPTLGVHLGAMFILEDMITTLFQSIANAVMESANHKKERSYYMACLLSNFDTDLKFKRLEANQLANQLCSLEMEDFDIFDSRNNKSEFLVATKAGRLNLKGKEGREMLNLTAGWEDRHVVEEHLSQQWMTYQDLSAAEKTSKFDKWLKRIRRNNSTDDWCPGMITQLDVKRSICVVLTGSVPELRMMGLAHIEKIVALFDSSTTPMLNQKNAVAPECGQCGLCTDDSKLCQCKTIRYCNKQHQKEHRHEHRRVCRVALQNIYTGCGAHNGTRSGQCGLMFDVDLLGVLLVQHTGRVVSERAAVVLTSILEYVVGEVLEIAGDQADTNNGHIIDSRGLYLAIAHDSELRELLLHQHSALLLDGGSLPHIHPKMVAPQPSRNALFGVQWKDFASGQWGPDDDVEQMEWMQRKKTKTRKDYWEEALRYSMQQFHERKGISNTAVLSKSFGYRFLDTMCGCRFVGELPNQVIQFTADMEHRKPLYGGNMQPVLMDATLLKMVARGGIPYITQRALDRIRRIAVEFLTPMVEKIMLAYNEDFNTQLEQIPPTMTVGQRQTRIWGLGRRMKMNYSNNIHRYLSPKCNFMEEYQKHVREPLMIYKVEHKDGNEKKEQQEKDAKDEHRYAVFGKDWVKYAGFASKEEYEQHMQQSQLHKRKNTQLGKEKEKEHAYTINTLYEKFHKQKRKLKTQVDIFHEMWTRSIDFVREMQRTSDRCIPYLDMMKLLQLVENTIRVKNNGEGVQLPTHDAYQGIGIDRPLHAMSFSVEVVNVLGCLLESHVVEICQDACHMSTHNDRTFVDAIDLGLVKYLRKETAEMKE